MEARVASMSTFPSSLLYWRLREYEDARFTGGLLFFDGPVQIGRMLFHAGRISWAEATGQEHTLLSALQAKAGIGKEDILFARSYQQQQGSTNIVTLMEKTGLAGFWMLRECMRLHLLSAVERFVEIEDVDIVEQAGAIASPGVLFYTLDELTFAEKLLDPDIPRLLESPGLEVVQVQMRKLGKVYHWPADRPLHDDFLDVGVAWYRSRPDNVLPPQMVSIFQPHSTYWVRFFGDAYETILVAAFLPGQDLKPVVDVLWHAPTHFLLQLEAETKPLVQLDIELQNGGEA